MLKLVAGLGILLAVFSGPICWAQETTTPPSPGAESATPETPPTPPVKQESPAPSEKKSKAEEKPPPSAAPPPAPQPPPASQPAPSQQPAAPPGEEKPELHKEVEKAIAQPEEEKKLVKVAEVERGGLLLAKGKLQLEFDFAYAHLSTNQIFLNGFSIVPILTIGNINIQRVRRDLFITTFTGRYGLMQDTQLEVKIPYQVSLNDVSTAQGLTGTGTLSPNEEHSTQAHDLGDVEATIFYQWWKERADRPALILGLAWKSKSGRDSFQTNDPANFPPSGTGFTSLRALVSLVKTADPAILFASLSYAYAFPRYHVVAHQLNQPPVLLDFNPGDNFTYGMGLAYAINYRLSLSFQFNDSITFPSQFTQTESSGAKVTRAVANSFNNAGFFRIGVDWTLTPKSYIELGLTQGLTGDAPDFTFEIKYPLNF